MSDQRGTRTSRYLCGLALSGVVLAWSSASAAEVDKGPWVQRVTSSSAVVRVEVQPPGPVSLDVEVGPGAADGGTHRVITSSESQALHSFPLKDLKPSTRYVYSVRAGTTSKLATFTTAPPDDGDAAFRFLVYGDNRSDDPAHAAIVRAMVPVASDFLINTGDFVEDGADTEQWQTFFDVEAPLLTTRCLFSCVGNHELTDRTGIEYARYFGPTDLPPAPVASGAPRPKTPPVATKPEHLDGTFRWGNTRFFLVNGMVSFKSGVDRSWLEKALADADNEAGLKWRIVVVHHGLWSSGPHGANARLHDAGIPALLKAHNIDLVISGHDHIYERGWGDGLAYLVSGGGGAPVYRIKSPSPQSKKAESVRHFVEMNVSGGSIQMVAYRIDGSTLDQCSLTKNVAQKETAWSCDGPTSSPSGAAPSSGPVPAASAPSPPSSPQASRCACRAVGARTSASADLGAACALLLAFALGAVRRRSRSARGGSPAFGGSTSTLLCTSVLGKRRAYVDTAIMSLCGKWSAVPIVALIALSACTTYRDQLVRGQRAFEQNDYDRTLALMRDLESDVSRLRTPEQAEYAYLRGMSDYRVGYRPDARHWLALAKSMEENSPGMLPADWKARVNEALDELNNTVYTQGLSALTTHRVEGGEEAPKSQKDVSPRKEEKGDSPKKEEPTKADSPQKKDESPKGDLPKKDGL